MQIVNTSIPGVLIIEPRVFGDERGFFFESFNSRSFKEATGLNVEFVQDNHSESQKNVLRGLHYQVEPMAQGKLVRVVQGAVFDVAVDLRQGSKSYKQWVGGVLSAENKRQMWVPPGFAHGFLTLTETAEFLYKTDQYYSPAHERTVHWRDPSLNIDWPLSGDPLVSPKDAAAPCL